MAIDLLSSADDVRAGTTDDIETSGTKRVSVCHVVEIIRQISDMIIIATKI